MKAMLFAAGIGSRLRPLTNDRPKALVEVKGVTMLELAIRKLRNAGVNEIVVNLHHFGEQIRRFVAEKNFSDTKIRFSDETGLLLDTGGGLKKAAALLKGSGPFIVYNVDILTDLSIRKLYEFHNSRKALATLAVKNRPGSRFFMWDDEYNLRGWKNFSTGEEKKCGNTVETAKPVAFSGVHIIEPAIFDLMHEEGVFSIVDVYLRLGAAHPIKGYLHDDDLWQDLGKPESLKKGEEMIDEFGIDRFL